MGEETDNLNELLEDALKELLQENAQESTSQKNDQSHTKNAKIDGEISDGRKTKKPNSTPEFPTMPIDEKEMDRFFANMTEQLKAELPKIDPQEAQSKINESVPQIFDLMQNLLSKELLYPALSDLSPKFEDWLEKNLGTLNKSDKKRYIKQKELIDKIISNFDDDSLADQSKFEKNLQLMEEMQSLGPPPDELTVPGGSRCPIM